MARRSAVRTAAMLLTLLLLAVGCGSGGEPGSGEPVPIRVGGTMGGSDVALFIAQDRGYFQQEGLNVELIQFSSGSDMIAPLGAGQLDVAGGAPSAGLFNAIGREVGLRIVADKGTNVPGQAYYSLLVRKDLVDSGQFRTFADLQGRRIAFTGAGNTTQALANAALESVGVSWNEARITQEFLGFSEQITALQNGSVDAGTVIEPFTTLAVRQGAAVPFPGDAFYPNQQVAVLMYGEKFIEDKPDAARRFMVAYMRAARDYNRAIQNGRLVGPGSQAIIDILVRYTSVKDPEIHRTAGPAGLNPDVRVSTESMQRDLDFWRSQGLVETPINVQDAVDHSFVDEALGRLGPYQPAS